MRFCSLGRTDVLSIQRNRFPDPHGHQGSQVLKPLYEIAVFPMTSEGSETTHMSNHWGMPCIVNLRGHKVCSPLIWEVVTPQYRPSTFSELDTRFLLRKVIQTQDK